MWLILLIMGQKWIDFVCTGQTVCVQSSRGRGGSGSGGAKVGPHQSVQLYFHDFVYLPWIRRPSDSPPPPCRILCYLFAVSQCTDPKYTPPVKIAYRTHTCTHSSGHTTPPPSLIEARVFPPARKASSCSTYTHSFPSPLLPPSLPAISSPPTGPQGLELSLRLLRTFSSFCSLFESLLSIYESVLSLFLHVHLLINPSLPILPFFLYLRLVPWGRKGTGGVQFQLRARSQTLLHLDFITNRPARYRRIIIRGKKWKKEEGGVSKACNVVNKFKLSTEKRLWYYFCASKPKCEPASFVLADTNWKGSVILNHMRTCPALCKRAVTFFMGRDTASTHPAGDGGGLHMGRRVHQHLPWA